MARQCFALALLWDSLCRFVLLLNTIALARELRLPGTNGPIGHRDATYIKELLYVYKTWVASLEPPGRSPAVNLLAPYASIRNSRNSFTLPPFCHGASTRGHLNVVLENDQVDVNEGWKPTAHSGGLLKTVFTSITQEETGAIPFIASDYYELLYLEFMRRSTSSRPAAASWDTTGGVPTVSDDFRVFEKHRRITSTSSKVEVELLLINPLNVLLECSKVRLFGILEPELALGPRGGGETTTYRAGLSSTPVQFPPYPKVRIEPLQSKSIRLSAVPNRRGLLTIKGVEWELFDIVKVRQTFIVTGSRKSHLECTESSSRDTLPLVGLYAADSLSARSRHKLMTDLKTLYHPDSRLQLYVSDLLPRLTVKFEGWPQIPVYKDEIVQCSIVMQNNSSTPIEDLRIIVDDTSLAFFRDSAIFQRTTKILAGDLAVAPFVLRPKGIADSTKRVTFVIRASSQAARIALEKPRDGKLDNASRDVPIDPTAIYTPAGCTTQDSTTNSAPLLGATPACGEELHSSSSKWISHEKSLRISAGITIAATQDLLATRPVVREGKDVGRRIRRLLSVTVSNSMTQATPIIVDEVFAVCVKPDNKTRRVPLLRYPTGSSNTPPSSVVHPRKTVHLSFEFETPNVTSQLGIGQQKFCGPWWDEDEGPPRDVGDVISSIHERERTAMQKASERDAVTRSSSKKLSSQEQGSQLDVGVVWRASGGRVGVSFAFNLRFPTQPSQHKFLPLVISLEAQTPWISLPDTGTGAVVQVDVLLENSSPSSKFEVSIFAGDAEHRTTPESHMAHKLISDRSDILRTVDTPPDKMAEVLAEVVVAVHHESSKVQARWLGRRSRILPPLAPGQCAIISFYALVHEAGIHNLNSFTFEVSRDGGAITRGSIDRPCMVLSKPPQLLP